MALDFLQWAFIITLLVLPFLYETSSTFRFYTKFILYYGFLNFYAILAMVYSSVRPRDNRNMWFAVWGLQQFRKLFGLDIEVRGRENLKSDNGYILVVNHQSSLDLFGLVEIWEDNMTSIVKKELIYLGPFGPAVWLAGAIFVDRVNRDKAVATMQKVADGIRENNTKVFIFPEGTRNYDGSLLPFKKGAFHLAVQAKVPIVPVVFSSYSEFYSKKEKRLDQGKFVITCLKPISTDGLSSDDVAKFADDVREKMLDVFIKTSQETKQSSLQMNGTK